MGVDSMPSAVTLTSILQTVGSSTRFALGPREKEQTDAVANYNRQFYIGVRAAGTDEHPHKDTVEKGVGRGYFVTSHRIARRIERRYPNTYH